MLPGPECQSMLTFGLIDVTVTLPWHPKTYAVDQNDWKNVLTDPGAGA